MKGKKKHRGSLGFIDVYYLNSQYVVRWLGRQRAEQNNFVSVDVAGSSPSVCVLSCSKTLRQCFACLILKLSKRLLHS